jgi:hypothetical protein
MNKAQKVIEHVKEYGESGDPETIIRYVDPEAVEVESELVEEKRWSLLNREVWSLTDGSFVELYYETPATEYQDCEYNTTAVEVEPYEVLVTKFREVS